MDVKRYIAFGPNCWGIGPTKEAAIGEAKKNWPGFIKPRYPKPHHFSVWQTDATEITMSEIDASFSIPEGYTSEKIQTSTLARKEVS